MKIAVVTTTINVPYMLEKYCSNADFYQHKSIDQIEFIVIADLKTPELARDYCSNIESKFGYRIHYLTLDDQENILSDYPELLSMFPYNCTDRKLLGMVIAFIWGFELFIMIDDDNFPCGEDFFGEHKLTYPSLPLVESSIGWYNVCELLKEKNNIPIFHRGYPWSIRHRTDNTAIFHNENNIIPRKVVINAGLWIGDPDIDATSRLFWPIESVGMKKETPYHFGLYPGTWCPWDNQSTSMAREVLPAYFTPTTADRYSDLFPAFVICKIAEHLQHIIAYGSPLVFHFRNPHNLWSDVGKEMVGAEAAESLISELRQIPLSGKTYHDCLGEINQWFSTKETSHFLRPQASQMLKNFFNNLSTYHLTFEKILKNISL